ncbi:MAG: ABC transporter permease [Planctomycetes bacterium]|nr:ABC transporter permease [Planctomycetota bacterium]
MALLVLKNLRRKKWRTILTCVATMALVLIVTMIWTVVYFLDTVTREKAQDFKLIVTERWQLPSQMPMGHADYLNPESPKFILDKKDVGPDDFMTWSFYGGTADPTKFTPENLVFFFCMNPRHIRTMMDDLKDVDSALVQKMIDNRQACLLGKERLKSLNKRVGERFKLTSINYKDINLEFEVVGELPEGRYDKSGIMNVDYFNDELDKYARDRGGKKHPLDEKRLNLIWLRVKDRDTFDRVAQVIESSSSFADRPVKCETASSGIGAFLDAYRDLLWMVKWLMVPAILAIMSLVVAIAISIGVRERRTEMAVLKVLGYRPNEILYLILGESLLVGALSGLAAGVLAVVLINVVVGGIPFPIAFFPTFMVPVQAILWGLAMGAATAYLGGFIPAYIARSVRVSEVFSKVA